MNVNVLILYIKWLEMVIDAIGLIMVRLFFRFFIFVLAYFNCLYSDLLFFEVLKLSKK